MDSDRDGLNVRGSALELKINDISHRIKESKESGGQGDQVWVCGRRNEPGAFSQSHHKGSHQL
jgi:hypothetical protein